MENNNSVAYITKISKVESIEGADKIEKATVNGWTSIVQKNIHKEGDLVLCITTDAIIPQDLSDKWGISQYLRKGYRVRTVKLKGTYSECILIPEHDVIGWAIGNIKEDQDMMSDLNITKYEPPVREEKLPSGKKIRFSVNPNFHVYYKFPNQKNTPNMFDESDDVIISRKIHGTNARYAIVRKDKLTIWDRIKKLFGAKWTDYECVYGSHNVQKAAGSQGFYSTDIWAEQGVDNDISSKLWEFVKSHTEEYIGTGIIIYGEIYGIGIQGEKYSYGLKKRSLAVIDIVINGRYLSDREVNNLTSVLALNRVPVLYRGKWSKDVQDSHVLGQYIEDNVPHEGVVVASIDGNREKISKVINPEYHIYAEKHVVPDSH